MYSFYCVMKWGKDVDYFVNLPLKHKAVLMQFIDEQVKREKKENEQIKRTRGRKR